MMETHRERRQSGVKVRWKVWRENLAARISRRKVSLEDDVASFNTKCKPNADDLDYFPSIETCQNENSSPSSHNHHRKVSLDNDCDADFVFTVPDHQECQNIDVNDTSDEFQSVGIWTNPSQMATSLQIPRSTTSESVSFVTAPESSNARSTSPTRGTTTPPCTTAMTTRTAMETTLAHDAISDNACSNVLQDMEDNDVRSTPNFLNDQHLLSNETMELSNERPNESYQCPSHPTWQLLLPDTTSMVTTDPSAHNSRSSYEELRQDFDVYSEENVSSTDDTWCGRSFDKGKDTGIKNIGASAIMLATLSNTAATPPATPVSPSSRNHQTPALGDCTSANISRATDESVSVNDRVKIIGGIHKGKTGAVKIVTMHRVGVLLDGMGVDAKPRYLVPRNVERILSSQPTITTIGCETNTHTANTTATRSKETTSLHEFPTLGHTELPSTFSDSADAASTVTVIASPNRMDAIHLPYIDMGDVTMYDDLEDQRISGGDTIKVNNSVNIICGTHKGRCGNVTKITAARAHVDIDGIGIRYLSPKNVRLKVQHEDCVVSHVLPGQLETARVSSLPRVSRSQPDAQTIPQRATVAQIVSLPTTPSKSLRKTVPSDSVDGNEDDPIHTFLGLREDSVTLLAPRKVAQNERTLAFALFGHRLRTYEINVNNEVNRFPNQYTEKDGSVYELLSTKLQRVKGCFSYGNTAVVKAQYVLVKGHGVEAINLKSELKGWAGFGRLEPRKVAARLELLQTTALVRNAHSLVSSISPSELEEIPECAHEGCGFMPVSFARKYMGHHAVGKRTFALQVRIISSRHGIFKGMLIEKPGISTIQLPSSMKKVGASEISGDDRTFIVIKGAFPSKTNVVLPKLFLPDEKVPKSFCPKKLSDMFSSVLGSRCVPLDVVEQYREQSHGNQGKGLEHAFLIGLSDPTGSIPSGYVFITGVHSSPMQDTIVVSRFPCTEASDVHLLPILKVRPERMSKENWDWLCRHHFGGIIFANPVRGGASLPSRISNGDLDGDLYLICWHNPIISHFELSVFDEADFPDGHVEQESQNDTPGWNESWLEQGQQLMGDIGAINGMSRLISILYKQWKSTTEQASDDATAFGRAYKRALDIGKHGGFVFLPRRLWTAIPTSLHQHLMEFPL